MFLNLSFAHVFFSSLLACNHVGLAVDPSVRVLIFTSTRRRYGMSHLDRANQDSKDKNRRKLRNISSLLMHFILLSCRTKSIRPHQGSIFVCKRLVMQILFSPFAPYSGCTRFLLSKCFYVSQVWEWSSLKSWRQSKHQLPNNMQVFLSIRCCSGVSTTLETTTID